VFPGLGRLWISGTTFLILPYTLHRMGTPAYGVLQVLLFLSIYFMYADAGLTVALPKYVAEYAARRDSDGLAEVVNTGVAYYSALASIGLCIVLALGGFYLRLNSIPASLMYVSGTAYRWAAVCGAITFAAFPFRGILTGLQRTDVINAVEVTVSVPVLFATVWVLATGKGLLGMIVVQFVQYACISAAIAYYAVRLLPVDSVNPLRSSRSALLKLLSFGWRIQCPGVALIAQGQIERTLLANMLGPASVGLYSLGSRLVDAMRGVFYPALGAVVPAASHLDAVGEMDNLRALYERGTKVVLALMFPIAAWLFAISPIFATAWMGRYDPKALQTISASIRFLAVCAAVQMTAGVCMSVARGLARLKPDLIASPLLVAVELGLGIWLGVRYHFVGIMSAGVAAFAVNTAVSIALVHRSFRWPLLPSVVRQYLPPILVAVLVAAPVVWFNGAHGAQILAMGGLRQRVLLVGWAAGETVIYGAAYVAIMWFGRYMSPEDLRSLSRASRGLRSAED
jgi:O-antigen/teichoic acid export membrane protein